MANLTLQCLIFSIHKLHNFLKHNTFEFEAAHLMLFYGHAEKEVAQCLWSGQQTGKAAWQQNPLLQHTG
jgi:hypothetical protein